MLELLRRRSEAGEAPSPSDTESTLAPTVPPTAAASTPRGALLACLRSRAGAQSGPWQQLAPSCAGLAGGGRAPAALPTVLPLPPLPPRQGRCPRRRRTTGCTCGPPGRRGGRRATMQMEMPAPSTAAMTARWGSGGERWLLRACVVSNLPEKVGRSQRVLTACCLSPAAFNHLQSSSGASSGDSSCSCSGSEAGSDGEDEDSPPGAAGMPAGGSEQQQQQHQQHQRQQPGADGVQPNGSASRLQRQRRHRAWHRLRRGRGGAASAASSGGGAEIPAGPVPLRLRRRSEAGSVLEPDGLYSETEDAEVAGAAQEPISEVEAEPSSP